MRRDPKPRYVQEVRAKGRVYRYLRAPGKPKVRLPDGPVTSPAFLRAYLDALGEASRPATGTIAALIADYLRSHDFARHRPAYAAYLRSNAETIRETWGEAQAAHLQPHHIQADIKDLPPHAANKRLKAWRAICTHGYDTGAIKTNPAAVVKKKTPPKSSGHAVWTREDMARYRQHWPVGTLQRAAFELLAWTGCRVSDSVTLGWHMVGPDGVLSFRQGKTGEDAFIPFTCLLPSFASYADRDQLHAALIGRDGPTFLAISNGRERSSKALSHTFSEWARAAGVAKSAHGLRKARATALANAGATTMQIAAWTGHLTLAEVDHYTKSRDRRASVVE